MAVYTANFGEYQRYSAFPCCIQRGAARFDIGLECWTMDRHSRRGVHGNWTAKLKIIK